MLSKKLFRKAKLSDRYNELKKHGAHIGVRRQGTHSIHLFGYNGFYVELWILISFNQVHWVEIQENKGIIKSYADNVDVKSSLGLE